MNESEIAGVAVTSGALILADGALTGSSAKALQRVNAGALPGSARMNVTAQPKPMDTTATSSPIPPAESQTSLAAMMHMMNQQNNGEVICQCAENLLALIKAEKMVESNDARRLGEPIAQRHAYSEQLAQRKQELLEAQRQFECTRQHLAEIDGAPVEKSER